MIAGELHISPKTVKNHISNILMKLQMETESRPPSTRSAPGSSSTGCRKKVLERVRAEREEQASKSGALTVELLPESEVSSEILASSRVARTTERSSPSTRSCSASSHSAWA